LLEYPTIRVAADDNEELTWQRNFSFQEVTLLQMKCHDEKLCKNLAALGFNSDVL
jgi:hypothetical protein